jgi:sugar/nucleoside kinase (ribokinase family)
MHDLASLRSQWRAAQPTAQDVPELVTVGHLTSDLLNGASVPGGAAFYASRAAHELDVQVGVVSAVGAGFPHHPALAGLQTALTESGQTTCFRNRYIDDHRIQTLCGLAGPITEDQIPERWRKTAAVYLCPVMGEVNLALAAAFERAWVAVGAQGWMRRALPGERVRSLRWRPNPALLAHVDLAVLSDEDAAADPQVVDHLIAHVGLVAFTRGRRGCDLYVQKRRIPLTAYPTREQDPTGAGDVFGVVMLLGLSRGWPPLTAARLAACAASIAVEDKGGTSLPRVNEAWKRLEKMQTGAVRSTGD